MSTASISRRLSRWVAGLAYSDLPAEVRDRACGVTLQGLVSCLLGRDFPETIQAIRLVEEEEPGCGGTTTVLVDGRRFTRAGAAFINSEMMFAGGQVGHLPDGGSPELRHPARGTHGCRGHPLLR